MADKTKSTITTDIVTINCQGLRSSDHRDTLFSWLNCAKVDFLCLQETHSTSAKEFSFWLRSAIDDGLLPSCYKCISSPGSNRSSGVAIIYRSSFSLTNRSNDQHGRTICGHFTANNTTIQLCNIYAPNTSTEGESFFQSLYEHVDLEIPCVLYGDFNTVVNPHIDRRGCNPPSRWAYNWPSTICELISSYDLSDIWRPSPRYPCFYLASPKFFTGIAPGHVLG